MYTLVWSVAISSSVPTATSVDKTVAQTACSVVAHSSFSTTADSYRVSFRGTDRFPSSRGMLGSTCFMTRFASRVSERSTRLDLGRCCGLRIMMLAPTDPGRFVTRGARIVLNPSDIFSSFLLFFSRKVKKKSQCKRAKCITRSTHSSSCLRRAMRSFFLPAELRP